MQTPVGRMLLYYGRNEALRSPMGAAISAEEKSVLEEMFRIEPSDMCGSGCGRCRVAVAVVVELSVELSRQASL